MPHLVESQEEELDTQTGLRPWHDDPEWIEDLCEGVEFKELLRFRFKQSGHINCLECRIYKSWLKHAAKSHCRCRILGVLDSRVTMGAAAKGVQRQRCARAFEARTLLVE